MTFKVYLKLIGSVALLAIILSLLVWISGIYNATRSDYIYRTNQSLHDASETEFRLRKLLLKNLYKQFFTPYPKGDTSKYVTKRVRSEDTTMYFRIRKDDFAAYDKIIQYLFKDKDVSPLNTHRLDSIFKLNMAENKLKFRRTNVQYLDLENDSILESSAPGINLARFNIVSDIDTLDIKNTIGIRAYVKVPVFMIIEPVITYIIVSIILIIIALACLYILVRDLVRLYKLGFKTLRKFSKDTEKRLKEITGESLEVILKRQQEYEDDEDTIRMNRIYDQINDESGNSGRFWVYMDNEEGKVRLDKYAVDIKPTLLELKEDFESIEYKKVTVTVKCPDDLILITDEIFLHRIIKELMKNSARYSDDEVHIDLAAEELKDQKLIVITVRDNGWGIPKEDLKSVFMFGYQVVDHVIRLGNDDGMGLGLPFVDSFTGSLGGAVNVTSFLNQFTQFQLIFPVTPDDEIVMYAYRESLKRMKAEWSSLINRKKGK